LQAIAIILKNFFIARLMHFMVLVVQAYSADTSTVKGEVGIPGYNLK
jgi:hypothetical protein